MRIDSHQHFWIFDAARDAWITTDMAAIRRNFLPIDLAAILKSNGIDGTIAVQASQSHEETQFLVDLSTMYAMIKGVVGWVDLQSPEIEDHVQHVVSYVSQFMTLLPGDVISTGTPAGVGLGFNPPIYLKAGDVVELGADYLGESRQEVVNYGE